MKGYVSLQMSTLPGKTGRCLTAPHLPLCSWYRLKLVLGLKPRQGLYICMVSVPVHAAHFTAAMMLSETQFHCLLPTPLTFLGAAAVLCSPFSPLCKSTLKPEPLQFLYSHKSLFRKLLLLYRLVLVFH